MISNFTIHESEYKVCMLFTTSSGVESDVVTVLTSSKSLTQEVNRLEKIIPTIIMAGIINLIFKIFSIII
jgi:hypothetical protein